MTKDTPMAIRKESKKETHIGTEVLVLIGQGEDRYKLGLHFKQLRYDCSDLKILYELNHNNHCSA